MQKKLSFIEYLKLFFTMMKIGAFTFGGGYAMIALLENEFVSKKGWLGKEEFLDMVAISESTPGPIAINSSTYIGYKIGGFVGSLVATLGMVIPSFTVIFIISLFFDSFLELEYVGYAFRGIQVCVIYLIFTAGVRMLGEIKKNAFNIIVMAAVFLTMLLTSLFSVNFSSIAVIILSGCVGVAVYLVSRICGGGGEEK